MSQLAYIDNSDTSLSVLFISKFVKFFNVLLFLSVLSVLASKSSVEDLVTSGGEVADCTQCTLISHSCAVAAKNTEGPL